MLRRFLSALAALVLFPVLLVAQDGPLAATGEVCVLYGAAIGIAVGVLKHLPFGIGKWIAKNPKTLAAVLSAVAALQPFLAGKNLSIAQLAACVAAYFAGSIASHETVLKYTPIG